MNIIDDFMGFCSVAEPSQNQSNVDEFERYLNAKFRLMDPFQFELLGWWFENRHTFPYLFRLFLSLAGVTASSAPAKRSFNETEIIITARRSNTSPETLSNLALARNMYSHYL